jgi:hypothetical protein
MDIPQLPCPTTLIFLTASFPPLGLLSNIFVLNGISVLSLFYWLGFFTVSFLLPIHVWLSFCATELIFLNDIFLPTWFFFIFFLLDNPFWLKFWIKYLGTLEEEGAEIIGYWKHPNWLTNLYWNIPSDCIFCAAISLLTEYFTLEHSYWFNISLWHQEPSLKSFIIKNALLLLFPKRRFCLDTKSKCQYDSEVLRQKQSYWRWLDFDIQKHRY